MGYSRPAKEGYEKPPSSMVMTRIGGRDYPLQSEPNCKTCQSPHRVLIEHLILQGKTPAGVAKELTKFEDEGPLGHPNKENIGTHYRQGHVPLPHAVAQELTERRAREIGKKMDDEYESIIDQHIVASRVMQTGFESLINGEISPTIAETLAAAKLVQDIESKADSTADTETWMAAMMLILEETRKLMPPELWRQLTVTLSNNPLLRAISTQAPKQIEV